MNQRYAEPNLNDLSISKTWFFIKQRNHDTERMSKFMTLFSFNFYELSIPFTYKVMYT